PSAGFGGRLLELVRPLARPRDLLLEIGDALAHLDRVEMDGVGLVRTHSAADSERQPRRDAERRAGHEGGDEGCDHGPIHERRPPAKLLDIHSHQFERGSGMAVVFVPTLYALACRPHCIASSPCKRQPLSRRQYPSRPILALLGPLPAHWSYPNRDHLRLT